MAPRAVASAIRFLAKHQQVTETGCSIWTSGCDKDGYGIFWTGTKNQRAHRVAWELAFGPVPPGMDVLHKCDTPSCVRPDHLFLGTVVENVQDKVAKGRGRAARGEDNGQSKLTEADVRAIRSMPGSLQAIADAFSVTVPLISMVKTRKVWSHVT